MAQLVESCVLVCASLGIPLLPFMCLDAMCHVRALSGIQLRPLVCLVR